MNREIQRLKPVGIGRPGHGPEAEPALALPVNEALPLAAQQKVA